MVEKTESRNKFYLLTVDVLQGFLVPLFITGHAGHWWDHEIAKEYWNLIPAAVIIIIFGMLALPCYLFLFGFNQTNSLMKRGNDKVEREKIKIRYYKRTIIFFGIAIISQAFIGILAAPNYVVNYLLTWDIFHMFALSTFVLIIVFQLSWYLEDKKQIEFKKGAFIIFGLMAGLILLIFLMFHDYSLTKEITYYVDPITPIEMLKRVFFDRGSSPIIPWLLFTLSGAITALTLKLPLEERESVIKRSRIVLAFSAVLFLIGISLLPIERYSSPAVVYPASSSFVFIAIGSIPFAATLLILLLDVNYLFSDKKRKINPIAIPFLLLGKVTLTIFIVHNVVFLLDPSFIPNIEGVIIFGFLVTIGFVILTAVWQKWKFKYSFEWFIWHLEHSSWSFSKKKEKTAN